MEVETSRNFNTIEKRTLRRSVYSSLTDLKSVFKPKKSQRVFLLFTLQVKLLFHMSGHSFDQYWLIVYY